MDSSARRAIVYGAFKGIGDCICAAPVIASELESGTVVTLLVYPAVVQILDLLDFGSNFNNLRICVLPVRGAGKSVWRFIHEMSRLSPDTILISPHAPASVASWKIPLLLWAIKTCFWSKGRLAGAASEPFSTLFDLRTPVNRSLPYMVREWASYSAISSNSAAARMPKADFKESIRLSRRLAPKYDVVIHPGAGTENRKWPVHCYADLVRHISPSHRIAVIGLPTDVSALRAVLPGDREIHFLTGSLENAIMAIARARVAMTMDSGSMYFAHLLGVPTVSLFGPSDPANVIPSSWNILPIYRRMWSCQPCMRPRCSQREVYCMNSLDPKRVAEKIIGLLDSTA
jgi:heptosyltransferase-2